jgi:cyclic pyranopterin phosphate synthase
LRPISYLRISLTDRCNYRCTYCMPETGVDPLPRADVLSFEELEAIVAALTQVGVRRVRLTGGEPTVRKDLLQLVQRLARLDLEDLSLSTNGERLAELARPLREAGLTRLNVSLDTLDGERFAAVTRRGNLAAVLAGLEAAHAAGFRHTKLNTVAMRGFNDDEVGALCRYAFAHDFIPRFIELMPMADGALFYPGTFLPAAELRTLLRQEFGELIEEAPAGSPPPPGVGPARYTGVQHQGRVHRVGLISAVTEPFCDTCNRIRLSATGQLHACLAYDDAIDLRTLLRAPPALPDVSAADHAAESLQARLVQAARAGLLQKRPAHQFSPSGCGGPKKHMVSIGG